MIRRFNFTGRKKIPRSRITVRVGDEGGTRSFDAELHLDGLGLPPGAEVYVEAYHRTAYLRFPFGTVGRPRIPMDRRLRGIPVANPLFRVKVVEKNGGVAKILAAADRIVPETGDPEDEGRQSLLVAEYVDLGNRVWELDLEGDWPTLRLNSRIDGIREAARSGPDFLTLVYPSVFRTVLTRIFRVERHTDPETDDDDWPTLWLRFACAELGCPRPAEDPEDASVPDWIDDAVEAFCARCRAAAVFSKVLEERSG